MRLLQRFTRTAEISQRLCRPRERAREPFRVTRSTKLSGRVAVIHERAFVVAAHAVQQSAEEDHPGQSALRTGREAIEPALECRDLAPLKGALAVVADELRRAPVISGLLEMVDRAVDISSCGRAFGVSAVELDDLRGGKELPRPRAEEFGEERLKTMASFRTFAHNQAGLLERRQELPRRAARIHRLVVFDALEQRPAEDRVLVAARRATENLAVEVGVELRAATLELAELLPAALAHEGRRESEPRGPAAGARVHCVDRVLGEIQAELAAQKLDRLGAGEGQLRGGDVEDGSSQPPARQAAELRRAPRSQHKMGVIREQIDELVPERCERRATANARMIVDEEDQGAERRELIGQRLRELREATFKTATPIQKRRQLLAEFGGVAPDRTDQISEQHKGVLVAALQGEPRRAPAGRTKEVRVLREEGRLAVSGRRVDEREPVALRAFQSIEQPLPPEERKR